MGNADVLFQVQQAVYGVLTADGTLAGLVTGVFDRAPENQPFPYITLGRAQTKALDTFDRNGHLETVTIDIWTIGYGMEKPLAILSRLDDLLDWQVLPVMVDFIPIYTLYKSAAAKRVGDGRTRQITVTYDIFNEQH